MSRTLSVCVALVLTCAYGSTVSGQAWVEIGDAGSLPNEAQPIIGCGPLQSISGSTSPGDFEDLYLIRISDPDLFVASTTLFVNGGSASFSTQLWLFDLNGLGIAGNDDCPFDPGMGPQSCLANIGPAGLGLLIQPGDYFFAITGFDNDPQSAGGPIFFQFPNNDITGPDGPGGFDPIGGWSGGGDFGTYDITLTGADFISPPPPPFEPGTKHQPPAAPCGACGGEPEDDESMAIDPVYLFSGEYYYHATDLSIAGRGLDFCWSRKYRSRIGPVTTMGNGWDFNYNIRIEPCGADIILHDGNTRTDVWVFDPGSLSWSDEEFFRELTQSVADGSFTLTFPDKGTWNFQPFDLSPTAGKINSSIDRNGNALTFEYDATGLLTTIHDSLDNAAHDRDLTIIYGADDLIELVTDFTGRQIVYDYYEDGDAGGSAGDLKSVTTPIVTGTPNGNDFPGGKTTVYTYTKGFADERLNHDLLTITDPKGQVYLANVYAHTIDVGDFRSTQDPANIYFDRVVRQFWGDQDALTGDIVDVVYIPQTPTAANNFAVIEAIVNDRVGDVKEFFYDDRNRGVMQRIYTGRANPDQATTDTVNRPSGQLRGTDPAFFETRFQFNNDSLVTDVIHPNLNQDIFVYDVGNPSRRSQGNMLQHQTQPGALGGDQATIIKFFEYDADFGSCCGTSFVTRHTDGRGNETLHVYDASGNRTQTTRRIPSIIEVFTYNSFGQMTSHTLPDNGSGSQRQDTFTYYGPADGCISGYPKEKIIDDGGFGLTTTYEYDCLGRMTRHIDPLGSDSIFEFNALDEIVRADTRETSTGSGVRYERLTFFDANGNVVRIDIENTDDLGVLDPNTHFTTIYAYDILNYMTRSCVEVGNATLGPNDLTCGAMPAAESITTEYEYDANRNATLVRSGEATNGNDPSNTVRTRYDERDLVFEETRAPGSPDQSTTRFDYDGNTNVVTGVQGTEDTVLPRITTTVYDGYDRVTSRTDPMGNVHSYQYDANGNVTNRRVDGELTDVPGTAGNVRLNEITYEYDLMDRRTRQVTEFFDTASGSPLPGGQLTGKAITTFEYSDTSQVTRMVDDNLHQMLTTYDTANRRSVLTDHKNNSATFVYDPNSNLIQVTDTDKSDLGNPDELFTTIYEYDLLDRRTRIIDNIGNTNNAAYDSRNNRTRTDDALGNETRYAYDGMNRLTQTIRDLDGDGADGNGTDITAIQVWDDNSRPVEKADDAGNTTTYAYDSLNRLTLRTCEDTTAHSYVYDVHHTVTTTTDANGSLSTCTYDLLNRLTNTAIVPGTGVSGDTTFEITEYDGLSRVTRAEDNDSIVTFSYDSRSRTTTETLNGRTTTSAYDGIGNKTQCTYPGGRVISCTFDDLNRKSTLSDTVGTIATYDYVGPGRVERREYGNGTRTSYTYDGITSVPNPAGDFGVRRIIRTTHSVIGGPIIDDRTYAWDRMYNKLEREDVRPGPRLQHTYEYDDIYRLTRTVVTDENPPPITVRDTTHDLDGVGNRTTVTGPPDFGAYVMSGDAPDPADSAMNQYTTTPFDHRQYDANGNLIAILDCLEGDLSGDGTFNFDDLNLFVTGLVAGGPVTCEIDFNKDGKADGLDVQPFLDRILGVTTASPNIAIEYDYRNRMVDYDDLDTSLRTTYAYDLMSRRIVRITDADGLPSETRYFYDSWRVCEEQDNGGATQATYVYGLYVDEVLNMQRGGVDSYYHCDDMHNVMAVTDGGGAPVERYLYDEYGRPEFSDGAGAAIPGSAIGNPYLFTGRRYDSETGWYYYRTRYLDPRAGRFTTRDTIGIWGDAGNLGNGYTYVGNNPWTNVDPLGMMNKAELIEWIQKDGTVSKADAKRALDAVTNAISGALKKGDKISLVGFGTFTVRNRSARGGRNPQTGKEIQIKAQLIAHVDCPGHADYIKNMVTGAGGSGASMKITTSLQWPFIFATSVQYPYRLIINLSVGWTPLTWPDVPTEDTLAILPSTTTWPDVPTEDTVASLPTSTSADRILVRVPHSHGDTGSSCWMRVAQPFAGPGRGSFWMPSATGADRVMRKRPGRTTYANITLKRGYIGHGMATIPNKPVYISAGVDIDD